MVLERIYCCSYTRTHAHITIYLLRTSHIFLLAYLPLFPRFPSSPAGIRPSSRRLKRVPRDVLQAAAFLPAFGGQKHDVFPFRRKRPPCGHSAELARDPPPSDSCRSARMGVAAGAGDRSPAPGDSSRATIA